MIAACALTPLGFITWLFVFVAAAITLAIVAGIVAGVIDGIRTDMKESRR